METSHEMLDEAITVGITYVKTIIGNSLWIGSIADNYQKNKNEILSKLEKEMVSDHTLVKIILNSIPLLCDLAKSACPNIEREHISLILTTVADLLKQPSFNGAIISTFFKILEALAEIHDSNTKNN